MTANSKANERIRFEKIFSPADESALMSQQQKTKPDALASSPEPTLRSNHFRRVPIFEGQFRNA